MSYSKLNSFFGIEDIPLVWMDEEYDCIDQTGPNNHFYGRKHTEETKQMMRENHYDCSGENNPRWGATITEAQKEKYRQTRCKKLYLFTRPDGSQYVGRSVKEEADKNDLHHPLLYKVLKGKQSHHKHWKVEVYDG